MNQQDTQQGRSRTISFRVLIRFWGAPLAYPANFPHTRRCIRKAADLMPEKKWKWMDEMMLDDEWVSIEPA